MLGLNIKKVNLLEFFKDQRKGLVTYLEDGDYEDGNFKSASHWEKWEWYDDGEFRRYADITGDRRLRSENGLIIYDDHIEDCCPEELEDGFYPPLPTNINENVDDNSKNPLDIPLLTKVAQQLMSETIFDVVEFFNRNHLFLKSPMYNHKVNFSDILINSPSYHGSVSEHIRSVYGLQWFEVNYVWLKYIDLIHQKIKKKKKLPIGAQSINESDNKIGWYYQYIFDSKYLSKVLEQLLSETKIGWYTLRDGKEISIKVGWDPFIGYQRDVSWELFKKHYHIKKLSHSLVVELPLLIMVCPKGFYYYHQHFRLYW